MAGLYRLECTRCGFNREGNSSHTVVLKDDGKEAQLPRGLEIRSAETITGMPWGELLLRRRIRTQYGLVCLNCGQLDYYYETTLSRNEGEPSFVSPGANSGLSVEQAAGYACRKCGQSPLYPLSAVTGRLRAFLARLGLSLGGVRCPQCRRGQLIGSQFELF
jgi:hypothetical protein